VPCLVTLSASGHPSGEVWGYDGIVIGFQATMEFSCFQVSFLGVVIDISLCFAVVSGDRGPRGYLSQPASDHL
jgi:hypothetical protein